MKYIIMASHCGDPSEVDECFDAPSDKVAIEKLKSKQIKKQYQWDYLWLKRIDVEEKSTNIF